MLITERYKEEIFGELSCYDRIVITGNIMGWNYAQGMSGYLGANKIKIFDFATFSKPLNEEIRTNIEKIASENNINIEFIRKIKAFRKDDRIQEIIQNRGEYPGIVHIFSAMETCNTYQPWHDKATGKTYLRPDTSKCLHYYIYFIDKEFGLCYFRIPTWAPFKAQFYMNGHNWLETKLRKNLISYKKIDNAFWQIEDFEKAQHLSDQMRIEDLHQALDIFATRYVSFIERLGLKYSWTIMQVEYATDVSFKRQEDLQAIYDNIIKVSMHTVTPDKISSFLGKKLSLLYEGEMGNKFNKRILGTCIKHQMGEVSIKSYDKHGIIFRIESTVNDVSQFKHYREVKHLDGTVEKKQAPLQKSIYSLFVLSGILKSANKRYLEFISTFDDPSDGKKKLDKVSETKTVNSKNYKGFNFFDKNDLLLLETISRGEFMINGFRNKNIKVFVNKDPSAISRILKRLRVHGLIKKAAKSTKYYITSLGKSVITAGLRIKNMFVIPELAELNPQSF